MKGFKNQIETLKSIKLEKAATQLIKRSELGDKLRELGKKNNYKQINKNKNE